MQPFSYMIIALTLYSVYMYFAKDQVVEYINGMDFNLKSDKNPKKDENMKIFIG